MFRIASLENASLPADAPAVLHLTVRLVQQRSDAALHGWTSAVTAAQCMTERS